MGGGRGGNETLLLERNSTENSEINSNKSKSPNENVKIKDILEGMRPV